jgi:propionyl-CoA synthetase
VGTPDPSTYWKLIEKFKVNGLYSSPTAMRALRKEDIDGAYLKKHDISTLRSIAIAG